ncbi:MAG: DUF3006 domain-containing protein [Clostridiaceae bacterium]|nr:DUF3006 domain-containing protein [Clostridiaceae bacterium]
MRLIIDRFEGIYAICETEDKTMINIERSLIPKEAKESDVLVKKDDKYFIDTVETEKRKSRIKSLLDDVFE